MKICTNCGYEGKPIRQKSGAFAILFFTLAITNTWALASQLFWIALPFAAISTALFVYWYFTTKCPSCKNVSMANRLSPAARRYMKNPHTPTSNVVYSTRNPEAEIYIKEA
ncbi:MAG: hypothetical protein R3240_07180 [Gammaproteobacteria bacterium]|nr:hypothetical protein [Gammaproteobacteria bacterium]